MVGLFVVLNLGKKAKFVPFSIFPILNQDDGDDIDKADPEFAGGTADNTTLGESSILYQSKEECGGRLGEFEFISLIYPLLVLGSPMFVGC